MHTLSMYPTYLQLNTECTLYKGWNSTLIWWYRIVSNKISYFFRLAPKRELFLFNRKLLPSHQRYFMIGNDTWVRIWRKGQKKWSNKREYSIVVTYWHTHPEIDRSNRADIHWPLTHSSHAYLPIGCREALMWNAKMCVNLPQWPGWGNNWIGSMKQRGCL